MGVPMAERKRILHVITGLNVGGAETWLCRLLTGMSGGCWGKRLEHRVVTLLPCGPLAEPIRALGVPVESLGMARGIPSPGAVLRLTGIMRSWRPDVVQTWLYHADLLGFAARALAFGRAPALSWGVRCAYMDFSKYGLGTRLTVRACAALSARVQTVVANSRAGARHHVQELGYNAGTMRVIENGVDLERYRPDAAAREELRREWGAGAEEVLVGMVARVDPMKGHDVFCRMARSVRDRCGDAGGGLRFVLCGQGTRQGEEGWPELQAMLEESGLAGSVLLLGQRRDVERVWAALDVAVLPSLGEGFPNALLEALACGVPAVALDVGDAAAIVGPGGAVVPATGDLEARARGLAGEVERLVRAGGGERVRLGRSGRVHVSERYALESAVGGWAEHFYGLACLTKGA